MHPRLAVLTVLAAAAFAASNASEPAQKPPSLSGMTRPEVVALLGEPDRVKGAGNGETLLYKLRRAPADYAPAINERLVLVPDVGLCVITTRSADHGVQETISIEPTTIDDEGQLTPGGLTTTQSRSVTFKKGERLPPEPAPTATGPKLKLKLTLDAEGRVRDWRATP